MSVVFLTHEKLFSRLPTGPVGAVAAGNPRQMLGEAVGQWLKCKGNGKAKSHGTFTFEMDSNIEEAVIYKLEEC